MRLVREASRQAVVPRLEIANSMWKRAVGLLGRRSLDLDQGMLFYNSNSIHTIGMRFTLDLIFLNRQMVVVKTMKGVRPGRITWPVWRASHVIELNEGFLDRTPVEVGEKLNVDSALS